MTTKQYFLGLLTRCKDEFFIAEFTRYYLDEGVDQIIIIDDDSMDKTIYDEIQELDRVTILYEKNINHNNVAQTIYQQIRNQFEWLIYVDVDEFITTKKNQNFTIRDEIKENFQDVDCIKVPWVMMSSGGRRKNPESVLHSNTWRWDHDKKHPNPVHKFRCRYDAIEVKCIFRPSKFEAITEHHPIILANTNSSPLSRYRFFQKLKKLSSKFSNKEADLTIVDSVNKKSSPLNTFFYGLREASIKEGYLLCYHYRIISRENDLAKIQNSIWYHEYTPDDLHRSDHNEIFDNYISSRVNQRKIFIIGFNQSSARTLHNFFKRNNLRCVYWKDNDLALILKENNANPEKRLAPEDCITNDNLLNGHNMYESANVFSNPAYHIENKGSEEYYKKLDIDYPGSKFILNIGQLDDCNSYHTKYSNESVVEALQNVDQSTQKKSEEQWSQIRNDTIEEIKEYFYDRPQDLLCFNIDKDEGQKIVDFLNDDFVLDINHYTAIR